MPLGASFPVVPTNPSRDDALKALTLLRSILAEFPFADGQCGASEAVMLSAIISAIMRAALGNVPLHAFNAPASRTGKSLAATLVSMISQGRAPALCTTGKNEDELEKTHRRHAALEPAFFPD
jgi:putative DNA primase/helicase